MKLCPQSQFLCSIWIKFGIIGAHKYLMSNLTFVKSLHRENHTLLPGVSECLTILPTHVVQFE
jgi:hypothetical protein